MKRFLISILFVLCSINVIAQTDDDFVIDTLGLSQAYEPFRKMGVTLPECALPDSNIMREPFGTSLQMMKFIEKLDSVVLFQKGRVNIVHIGGSHVQADMYTHVIRQNIDSLNGELTPPRGFIFPYKVAKTNNPFNYRVSYSGEWKGERNAKREFSIAQGVSGILVHTTDASAQFSIDLNTDSIIRWTTNKVHLICESARGTAEPMMIVSDSIVLKGEAEPTGFLFTTNENISHFSFKVKFDSLQSQNPDTFIVRGIYADNEEPGIVYSSIGVNGASVPSYLGCVNFEHDLALVKPDLVVLAIGINDAVADNFSDSLFVAHYDTLLTHIRNVSPDCAFIFITNNDSFRRQRRRYYVNKNGLIAREAFYELGRKWQSPVWDLFEIMGGLGSMQKWQDERLAQRDKIHFTSSGYALVGQMFYDAFMQYYFDK